MPKVTVNLPKPVYDKLCKLAVEGRTTLDEIVTHAIKTALENAKLQIEDILKDQLEIQIEDILKDQLEIQIEDILKDQLEIQIEDILKDQLEIQIEDILKDQLEGGEGFRNA